MKRCLREDPTSKTIIKTILIITPLIINMNDKALGLTKIKIVLIRVQVKGQAQTFKAKVFFYIS